jgi:ribonucleotide monophosphatase NagD (HAD superfamily)
LGVEAHIVSLLCRFFYDLKLIPSFKDEIYGSAYASAVYISSVMKMPKDQKVYVIGMSGIEEELHEEGVSYIGGTVSESTQLSEPQPPCKFHFRIQPITP